MSDAPMYEQLLALVGELSARVAELTGQSAAQPERIAVLERRPGCSTGWISSVLAQAAGALVEVEALIQTPITLAHLVHVDETSLNVAGSKQWLLVACTEKLTAYHLHESRAARLSPPSGYCTGSPASWCTTR